MTQSGGPFYRNPNKKRQPQQENDPRSDHRQSDWSQNPGGPEAPGAYDPASHGYQDQQDQFGNQALPGNPNYSEHNPGYPPQEQPFYPAPPEQSGAYDTASQPYQQPTGYGTPSDYDASQASGQYGHPTSPSFGSGGYENPYPQHPQTPVHHEQQHDRAWPAPDPHTSDYQPQYNQPAFPDNNQNYDLSNYKPQMQGNQPDFGEAGYTPAENWQQGAYAPAGHPTFGPVAGEISGGNAVRHNDTYDDDINDDYEEEDEESGSRRGMIIAIVLVSTIIVGGVFAYGYNTLFSKRPEKQRTPIVNANKNPARVQPADPGGRKFENTDNQLMNRIGNRGEADTLNENDPDGNRVRTVSTLVVGRDGRLIVENEGLAQPPSQTAQPQSPAAQARDVGSPGIPGMIIEGGAPQTPATNETPQAAVSQPAVSVPPVTTPQVETPQVQQTTAQEDPPATQEQSRPVVTRRRNSKFPPLPQLSGLNKPGVDLGPETPVPATSEDNDLALGPQPSNVSQVAAGPAPSGYVAVLSTKRSRIDALTSFADLQQRYPSILGTKVPDVRRADLTNRGLGVMYRAVVGPPGSREIASQLCDRLKTVGYQNCWVSAY